MSSDTKKVILYGNIKKQFENKFGHSPLFFARAPGRVNLIGEHIDYCGYGVLPMAIEQDIIIAASTNDEKRLHLSNTNSSYKDFQCDIQNFDINKTDPQWFNYFLCGLKGMTEHLGLTNPTGLNCMTDGTVPKSAGLSSSSALVCCSALTVMHANGQSCSRKDLADLCASCERYIGTQGGGMDQAISFMAEAGSAKKIDFNPLREQNVTLPDSVTFVISNSCVELNKAATSHFNTRVVECRIASQILAKSQSLNWRDYRRFGEVQEKLGLTLEDAVVLVKQVLHPDPYSKSEVCQILDVSPEELAETSLSSNTLSVQSFKLYDRATHVFTEADRVQKFKEICDTKPAAAAEKLGQLMNYSHASCRDLYECSCPELDELVDICVQSGALGSRLTGAGWGGCAVSMVPTDHLDAFLERVTADYYQKTSRGNKVKEALFATQPGSGAAIYTV
ncbi:hypothetical protein ACJMK2_043745 [Sinanodonta woodiana]|uniref:N-acetylgalactosamine kinase n=1 Tax=Sinanodonta woodiana TaxID=1069815 RepID=A0ABD3VXV2_SINWO